MSGAPQPLVPFWQSAMLLTGASATPGEQRVTQPITPVAKPAASTGATYVGSLEHVPTHGRPERQGLRGQHGRRAAPYGVVAAAPYPSGKGAPASESVPLQERIRQGLWRSARKSCAGAWRKRP